MALSEEERAALFGSLSEPSINALYAAVERIIARRALLDSPADDAADEGTEP